MSQTGAIIKTDTQRKSEKQKKGKPKEGRRERVVHREWKVETLLDERRYTLNKTIYYFRPCVFV